MLIGKIEGLQNVIKKLKEVKDLVGDPNVSVVVGYTANYALFVHENMEMKLKGKPRPRGRGRYWDPQGKAGPKFLEGPARELQSELARVVREMTKKTRNLEKGLLAAGLRLQRESQKRVPVDTGNLKNSAFTAVESI